MNIDDATKPAADEDLRVLSHAEVARGGIAPASMIRALGHHMMLRGPMVAYAPEDEGGAVLGGGEGDEAGGEDDDGGAADTDLDDEAGSEDGLDDDGEEIEVDGQKHRIPKALKGAFLMQKDYTQKTQASAAERQAQAEEHQARLAHVAAAEELATERAKVVALDEQVGWYEAQNWTELQARDPDRAQELWMAYQQLKLRRDNAAKEFDGKRSEHLEKGRQADKARLQKVDQALADPVTGIKDWGEAKFQSLVQFAASNGLTKGQLATYDAPAWKMLHDAQQWREHQAKQKAVHRQAQSQSTTPARTVATRSASPSAMSDRSPTDDWMKARNEQVRKRA